MSDKREKSNTSRKLILSFIAIIALVIALCISSMAFVTSIATSEDHSFNAGEIKINLNDGQPVITED